MLIKKKQSYVGTIHTTWCTGARVGRKAMTRLFVVPTPVVPDVTSALNFHGSLKKRVAPAPPPTGLETSLGACGGGGGILGGGGGGAGPHYGTLPTASHSRTTSEPILTSYTTGSTTIPALLPAHALRFAALNTGRQGHKRSPSGDYSAGHGPDELRKLNYRHRSRNRFLRFGSLSRFFSLALSLSLSVIRLIVKSLALCVCVCASCRVFSCVFVCDAFGLRVILGLHGRVREVTIE